jgi:long-subunit acyl-CoA synthetase (AMP-forming)
LVPDEFSAADGTLTHTLKVRRRGIEERYGTLIDDMYAKADAAPGWRSQKDNHFTIP